MHKLFYKDSENVKLFKQLVNAAKNNSFSSLPESVKSVFINELEKVREYVDKLIKQPAYDSGWRKRITGETPDDIEKRILKREFSISGEDDAGIDNLINEYTIRNLDYYKFLYMIADIYAALRTLNVLRKNITNPYIQPIEYVDEYHKSFGFDVYDLIPAGTRREILLNELSFMKKKGTVGLFGILMEAMGYNNLGIFGYWLDKDFSDSLYKFFPRLIEKIGNVDTSYTDGLIVKVNDNDDPLWYLTNSDLVGLEATGNYTFPSRSPYIGLLVSQNLADMTTINSLLFGSIFFATTVFRNELQSTANIGINSYGKDISVSDLFLAIDWLDQEYFGWSTFTSEDHKALYIWNGDYVDDDGNVLDDDTLSRAIINTWKSIFTDRPTIYTDKISKQQKFREKFLKLNLSDTGYVNLNSDYSLEYVQFVDSSSNTRVYPDEYLYNNGQVNVIVNDQFSGIDIIVTALDKVTEKYETSEYYIDHSESKFVSHNLDNKYNIVVQFSRNYDYGTWITALPDEIEFVDNNNLILVNNSDRFLDKLFITKVYTPDYTEDVAPSSSNSSITITHNLGTQYPIVELVNMDTDKIEIPQTITFKDTTKFVIDFGSTSYGTNYKVLVKAGNEYTLSPLTYDSGDLYLISDGTKSSKTLLQERNSDFYDYLNSEIIANHTEDRLKELYEAAEIYLYDVANIYFPFRQFIFGIDDDVYRLFNWVKPYHVKLLKILYLALINDPVNDAMLVGDHKLFNTVTKLLKEYVFIPCRYDIGGIYTTSGWRYDKCRIPDDSEMLINVTIKLLGGFRGLRYDIGHKFDTGYIFDMSPQIGDGVVLNVYKQLSQQIEISRQLRLSIHRNLDDEDVPTINDSAKIIPTIYKTEDDIEPSEVNLFNITKYLEEQISKSESMNIQVNIVLDNETIDPDDLTQYLISRIKFSESITIDDSNITITEYH